jgi:hypothetical protein
MYISCPFLEGIRNDRFCRSSDLLRIYRLPTIRILAVAQVIGKSCNRRSQQRDCLGVTPNSLFMEYTERYPPTKPGAKIRKIYV